MKITKITKLQWKRFNIRVTPISNSTKIDGASVIQKLHIPGFCCEIHYTHARYIIIYNHECNSKLHISNWSRFRFGIVRAFDDSAVLISSDQGGPGSALCSLFFCYILSPLVVHSVVFFASVADPFFRSPPPPTTESRWEGRNCEDGARNYFG